MREFKYLFIIACLVLFQGSASLFAQNLVVTKDGDIFDCTIENDGADSLAFSIPYLTQTIKASLSKKNIAYSGNPDFLSPANRAANKRANDIIIKKSGEVLKCNITSTYDTDVSFSFFVGQNEIKNAIPKDQIAYYKKSYLTALDLQEETVGFVTRNYVDPPEEEVVSYIDSTSYNKDLVVTKSGEVVVCTIEADQQDSLKLSLAYWGEKITLPLHKKDIAYSGKGIILKPSGRAAKEDDLIVTKAGVILKCNITSNYNNSISYAFYVGDNQVNNTITWDKIAYYKKSYLVALDLDKESAKFMAKNYVEDEIEEVLATQKWARDSVLLDKDLVVTKDGAVITCTIDEEQADSVTFTIPYMGNVVRVSMSRDEIAYAGKAAVLKPSGGSGSADDLIIKKTGEIMVCDITSNYNNLIGFSFTVGGNKINNTIKTEQIAYYRKSYKGNMDLNKESARFISKHNADKIERFSDQMAYSKDLIVNEDGGEVVCKIDNVGQNKIYYSTYENEQRKQGSISKFDVEYYVKNYAENPEDKVVLLDFEKDRGELIITSEGQYYPGEIINVGYNSIEFKEAGSADKRYFNMADVLYYGKSFLNTIREGNKLQHPTYTDLIYKSNNSVLLCQIDKVTLGNVRYSFILGGRTLYNDVPKDDIVYYGVNIFNDEDGAGVLAQKTEPTTTKEEEIGKTKDQANTDPEDQANTDQEAKVEKVKKEVASEPVAMKQEEKVVEEKVVEEPRDDTPPELILFTPQITSAGNLKSVENETSKVRVSGIILDDGGLSELMINGDKVSTTKEGKFDLEVSLAVGDNSISILASDKSSNALSESFSIVREQQVAQAPVQKKAADSEPPVLSISYPRPETPGEPIIVSNATKRVQIAGNVNDESGVFEVLVNNRDATLTATGDFRINIPLRVGENTLTIKASDLYFNDTETSMIIQRQDATVSYDTPEMIEDGAKYYALLIGVSDYQDPYIPSLDENPINDAKRLSEVLKEKYYFEEENMFYMPDPNRSDILRTFDRLSRSITDKDNLLIFFAGHGYYDEQTELGYWLPADAESEFTANWIYNDVLVANLKRINSRHTLLISDACFSGSIFKTRAMPGTAGVAYMKKYELSSRKAITSGVLESVPNESIFFKYFIEYLENNQEAMFSASELFRNIEIPIGNNSPNSPLYGVIQNVGDEGGDFLFIRR